MDDKTGNFDPRGGAMPKEAGKPPNSHGNVLPAGHRIAEGLTSHHMPMYPGSMMPGQFLPYGGYRADLGVLAAAAAVREQQIFMGQNGPPRSQEDIIKERMNRERAVEAHHREFERVNAAREMERVGVGDMRGREERMRDIAAEQAVQQHFEESLRRAGANQKQARQDMTQQSSRTPGYTTALGLPKAELNFASAFSYHNHPHPAHTPHSVHQQQSHHQQHQQQQHQQQHQHQQQNRNSPVKREISPQEVKHGATPRSSNRDSESYSGHTGYIVHNYKTASPGPSQTHRGSSPRQSPNLGPIPSKPTEKQSYTYPAPSRTPTEAFDQGRIYQDSRRYNSSPNVRQSPSPALTHPQTMPAPKNTSPGLTSNVPYRPSPGITTGIPVFRPTESSIALTTKPSPSPSPLSRSYYPERTPPPPQLSLKHPSPQIEPLDLGKKPCFEDSQAKKQKLESLEVLPPSRMISVAELISSTLDKETPQHPQLGRGLKIIDTDSKGSVLAFTADVKRNVSPPKDGRIQPPQFAYPREHVIREPVISREPIHRESPREAPRDLSREMYKDFREQQRDLRPVNNEANRTHRESSTDQRDIVQDMTRSRESVSYQSVINARDLSGDPVIDTQKGDVNLSEPQCKIEMKLEPDAAPSSKTEENLGAAHVLVKDDIDIKKDQTEAESVSPLRIETKSETDSGAPASANGSAQPVRKLKAAWLQRMANNDSVTPSIKPIEEGGSSDQAIVTETKPEVTADKDDKKTKRGKNGKKSDSSAESDESDKEKKIAPNEVTLPLKSSKNPFNKPSVASLKKSGESFLQDSPCYEVAPRLGKCRECRMAPSPKGKKVDLIPNANIFCRFYAFRRLRYTKTGQLAVAGFSDPGKDPQEEDLSLWLPNHNNPPTDLDTDVATFLLNNVGDQFCKLLQVEKEAAHLQKKDGQPIAWKRVVQGVREMCDVCETTLFNFHWVCGKCGFVACIDCYRARFSMPGKERDPESENKENGNKEKEIGKLNGHDSRGWLLCSNRFAHLLDSLMPTQIIAGNALDRVSENLHLTRAKLGLPQNCGCSEAIKYKSETENLKNGSINKIPDSNSLTRVRGIKPGSGGEVKLPVKVDPAGPSVVDQEESTTVINKFIHEVLLADDAPSQNGTDGAPPAKRLKGDWAKQPKHWYCSRSPRLMTLDCSKLLYPTVPHSWECEGGTLLRIENCSAPGSQDLFHDQWMRGQPVVVAKVSDKLNVDLWTPDSFSREFGSNKNHFVNCITGNIVPNQPMSKFWEGFEKYSKRLKDEKGQPMLLKLKDWPQTDDFAELLTTRFEDLMKALPFGDYTQRNGRYNLAGRLPDCFVRPDLGPKMYVAYGHPTLASVGTTNLHVDVSCAVNVMVHICVPQDTPNNEDLLQESFKCLENEKVDNSSIHRIKKNKSIPGAIWHIYHANDADKIRDLLTKIAIENGETIGEKTDPIHDQVNYLDSTLRERLQKEYNVRGYTIVQCLGDALFIPAGAPHQVRNLNSCIKVAEDFVSPENISRCLLLTEEFRSLSDKHGNHEDKLQLKNIIYHAVKDCLSVLNQNKGIDKMDK